MSADLISSMLIMDRPKFDSERAYLEATSLEFRQEEFGRGNAQGRITLQLPPNYTVKITAQSNASWVQYAKVINYDDHTVSLFKGRGEGVPMTYDGQTEINLPKTSQWRTFGLQFGYEFTGKIGVSRIRSSQTTTLGHDIETKVVAEDSEDNDFNDTVLTISMKA